MAILYQIHFKAFIIVNKDIFKSDRYFIVFDYSPGHGRLLLRSDKRTGHKTNIDIIFYSTVYMQINTMLNGISIRVIGKKEPLPYDSLAKFLSYPNNNLFEVESNGERYMIGASFIKVFENELEFNETTLDNDAGGIILQAD